MPLFLIRDNDNNRTFAMEGNDKNDVKERFCELYLGNPDDDYQPNPDDYLLTFFILDPPAGQYVELPL